MNCLIHDGDIHLIEIAATADIDAFIDRLPNSLTMQSLTLAGGAQWQPLSFLPETANLVMGNRTTSDQPWTYEVPMQFAAWDDETTLLINTLQRGTYVMKVTDKNEQVFVLGRKENGGRFVSSGDIMPGMDGGQNISLSFQVTQRQTHLKV